MPVKLQERQYRSLLDVVAPTTEGQKHFDTEYYVEGYAANFKEYIMYEYDGVQYWEKIDRAAFVGADMSDVIMQYDHEGRVAARTSNNTLFVEAREDGLFIAADLGSTEFSRSLHEDISKGLVTKMSWAFSVAEEWYDSESRTRHIKKIKKVYDVSAVSIPANDDTTIQARSFFNGVIEDEQRESLLRKRSQMHIKLKLIEEEINHE